MINLLNKKSENENNNKKPFLTEEQKDKLGTYAAVTLGVAWFASSIGLVAVGVAHGDPLMITTGAMMLGAPVAAL